MKKSNLLMLAAFACIFAAIGAYVGIQKLEPDTAQTTAVAELFAATMADSKGQPQALAQWKGKTLVLNFWATWCAPCVKEMPELSGLQIGAQNKNIQIVGIGIDSAANIVEFSSKQNISYPLYVADIRGAELARKFGNQSGGLPFTVLIDQDGRVKKSYLGRLKMEELKGDLGLP